MMANVDGPLADGRWPMAPWSKADAQSSMTILLDDDDVDGPIADEDADR